MGKNALLHVDIAHAGVHLGVFGIQAQGSVNQVVCIPDAVEFEQELAVVINTFQPARFCFEGCGVSGDCLDVCSRCLVTFCQIHLKNGMVGVCFESAEISFDCGFMFFALGIDGTYVVKGKNIIGILVHYVFKTGDCIVILLHLTESETQIV